MTDRELMQQALDLLDDINQCSLPPTGIPLPAEIDHVMEALRYRIAQPEQEPVAWIKERELLYMQAVAAHSKTDWKTNLGLIPEEGDMPLYTAPPKILCDCGDQIMPDDGAECGTCVTARNAVKPEWVGLTDEQKKMAYALYGTMTAEGFVKSLETKLREKNT